MKATGKPSIPIDPQQGEYVRAILLAMASSALAAVLPAWSASRIDPSRRFSRDRMSVLEATDIQKTFGEGEAATIVLRGISARVEKGECVALVGPSGSGKSTFLSIAGTLLTPSAGTLRIAGDDVLGCTRARCRRCATATSGSSSSSTISSRTSRRWRTC